MLINMELGNVRSKLQNVPCSRAAPCDVTQLYVCVCVRACVRARIKSKIYETCLANINPSAWGHLIPSSYCDVGRFPAGYLTFELNCAGIYSN